MPRGRLGIIIVGLIGLALYYFSNQEGGFVNEGGKATSLQTSAGEMQADRYVLATGACSRASNSAAHGRTFLVACGNAIDGQRGR